MFILASFGLCADATAVWKLEPTSAFEDCTEFKEPKKNGKTQLIPVGENGTLCFKYNAIIGSNSEYTVDAAFQKKNSTTGNYYWEYARDQKKTLAVLGEMDDITLNTVLPPVFKVTCKSSGCKIQVLGVDPAYEKVTTTEAKGVTTETRNIRRVWLNSLTNGEQDIYIRKSISKVNDSYIVVTNEISSAHFAFGDNRKTSLWRNSPYIELLYSGTGNTIKKQNVTVGSIKTSYFDATFDNKFVPTGDTYDYNFTTHFSWGTKEQAEKEAAEDTDPSYFPEVYGQLSTNSGAFSSDDFNSPESKGLPPWGIALIVIGCVAVVAIIAITVICVIKKKNSA